MSQETPPKGHKREAISTAKTAADTAKTLVEGTSNAINMIKWVAIAIIGLVILGGSYLIYSLMSAPVKAVGNASKAVTESVKSGAATMKDGTSDVLSRLVIPSSDQALLYKTSETAFDVLTKKSIIAPDGLKQNLFWKANLPGHENRVCTLSMNFGAAAIPVLIAADNKAYAPSKALGSNKNRMLRFILRAPHDDMVIHVIWDDTKENWVSKWRGTTMKKPLEDDVAANRILDVLVAVPENCAN